MKPILYRVSTVAQMLDMSTSRIYELVKEGFLKSTNHVPGRRGMRIIAASVEEYVKKTTIPPDYWQQ